jgi:hypothetical protein
MAQASNVFDPWSDQVVQHALRSFSDPPAALVAELDRVRGLCRALGASLKEIVNSWPLSPVSFCAYPPSVVSSSTQGLTESLRSAILHIPGACIRFDPDWVAADVQRFGDLANTIFPDALISNFLLPHDIVRFYGYVLSNESTVSSYLYSQLQAILEYALPRIHPPKPGLTYKLGQQPVGPGPATAFGTNKPDLVFRLRGQDSTVEVLMTGEIKLSVVMSLSVMRWIVWWARQNYRVQVTMPEGLEPEQRKALQILQQVGGTERATADRAGLGPAGLTRSPTAFPVQWRLLSLLINPFPIPQ